MCHAHWNGQVLATLAQGTLGLVVLQATAMTALP